MEIYEIKHIIATHPLGEIISLLSSFIIENNIPGALTKVSKVKDDYNLLKQYYIKGYDDKQRDVLILSMRRQLYAIVSEIIVHMLLRNNRTFKSIYEPSTIALDLFCVEPTLMSFEQELSIASVGGVERKALIQVYKEQFEFRKKVFNRIVTSSLLSEEEMLALETLLLSPMVDTIDRQIVLSAIILALQLNWDARKFALLCLTYGKTEERILREQSLIGVVLTLPTYTDDKLYGFVYEGYFNTYIKTPDTRKRLEVLQSQLIITKNTDKADQVIEKDIMPTLRNHAAKFSTESAKDDELSRILNPEIEEESMEQMEKAINRMRKLKVSGIDVLFSGFSKTKRYSFFYTLMNWFCPFYIEHPQLNALQNESAFGAAISNLIKIQQMCSSDKYSFVLSLLSVMKNMPPQLAEMLGDAEKMPFTSISDQEISDFEIRQLYLQDLYRFYNLFPFKSDFNNFFSNEEKVSFINHFLFVPLFKGTDSIVRIGQQILKYNMPDTLNRMLEIYGDVEDFEMKCLKAMLVYRNQSYKEAYMLLCDCISIQPDNILLVRKAADSAFHAGLYIEAENLYSFLLDSETPDNNNLELSHYYALSLLYQHKVDKAMTILFRLYYDDAGNIDVKSSIAWGYLLQGKDAEAVEMFDSIDIAAMDDDALWFKSISLLLLKRIEDAVVLLRMIIAKTLLNRADFTNQLIRHLYMTGKTDVIENELSIITDIVYES